MTIKRKLLNYLAGFFDGEGCRTIACGHQRSGKEAYKLGINVIQKDKTILNLFECLFGGKIRKRTGQEGCYVWYLYGKQALLFLKDISPYLILKSPQAKIAIAFQDNKVKRNHSQLTTETLVIEQAQAILLKEAKK